MKVLTTSGSAQTFKVIPREYVTTATAVLTDDSTNTVKTYSSINCTTSNNHLSVPITFSPVLVEGHFYDIRFYTDYNYWNTNYQLWENDNSFWNIDRTTDATIYRDRIFCTDQEIDQKEDQYYDLNLNVYKTFNASNSNQYKVF